MDTGTTDMGLANGLETCASLEGRHAKSGARVEAPPLMHAPLGRGMLEFGMLQITTAGRKGGGSLHAAAIVGFDTESRMGS